jgi:hypothetical protein
MLLTYVEEINPGPDVDWEKFCKERIDEAVAYAKRPWTDEEYEKWADNQLKDDEFRDWSDKKKALFKKLMIEGKKAEPEIWDSTLMFRTICDIETIEKCKELIAHGEGVKFERTNVEYEENEFERIRGEYNVHEN